jgi:hypothetical protein
LLSFWKLGNSLICVDPCGENDKKPHYTRVISGVGEVGEATGDGSCSVSPSSIRRFSLCLSAASLQERLGESLYRVF